jgi:hypothetical protein
MLGEAVVDTTFSIEMTSKHHVKTLTLANDTHMPVLVEGDLGELQEVTLVEGDVLEFVGTNGVLRIDVRDAHLETALRQHRQRVNRGSEVGSPTNTITLKDVKK